jgi:hypothetical protein
MYAYMLWADVTAGIMKMRNGANSAWISLWELDGTFIATDISLSAGTAGAPSLYFTGDTNTGIYSPGADQVAISTGGTGRLFVSSAGLVGIGTSSVSELLQVSKTGGANIQVDSGSSNVVAKFGASGAGAFVGSTSNDYFQIYSNNTARIHVTSAGLVGIGTNNPQSAFVVSDGGANGIEIRPGAGESDIIAYNRSGAAWGNLKLNSANNIFQIQGTEKARIDNSGRLLVGTSSALTGNRSQYSQVAVVGNSSGSGHGVLSVSSFLTGTGVTNNSEVSQITLGCTNADFAWIQAFADGTPASGSYPGRLTFSTTADGAASPTERMRLSNIGSLSIFGGTNSNPVASRHIAAAGITDNLYLGYHSATDTTNGTLSFIVRTNGNVLNTNNSYGAISDAKLKENIIDAGSQWSDLKALQVRKYNFKESQTHTQIGLVAQEVELVSPGLVSESPDRDKDGNDLGTVTKSVNYSVLYMKAVKALQEAMERIETLEASNTGLLARVTALESA